MSKGEEDNFAQGVKDSTHTSLDWATKNLEKLENSQDWSFEIL